MNLCIGYGAGEKVRISPIHLGAVAHIEKGGLRVETIHWPEKWYEYHREFHLLLLAQCEKK
jgi:hypothetical protein